MGDHWESRKIQPRTREDRYQSSNKDALEKRRINDRREGHARPETSENLIICPTDTSGYIAEQDRFHTNAADEEREFRMQERERREEAYAARRQEYVEKEEERWRQMEVEDQRVEDRTRQRREAGAMAHNANSVSFNPVTLQYAEGPEGDRLRHEDAQCEYRAAYRANNLYTKGNAADRKTRLNSSHIPLSRMPSSA
eukprot:TRINITY_DN4018_c0_g1_i1.p1 TRINITY_DN4018_c0_g1~~TRINITY_DN4018_c0_g1_i1.p1  ORF type:complete len:197 (+),score=47.45 TRINITY_DN4018_c0_g1_i1:72-662(+)